MSFLKFKIDKNLKNATKILLLNPTLDGVYFTKAAFMLARRYCSHLATVTPT
jgi:hypothetical protein